jgi:hypothetical protein
VTISAAAFIVPVVVILIFKWSPKGPWALPHGFLVAYPTFVDKRQVS